ncbi:MAG: iron-sulfur cluster assembly scaffold protein [Pseudomonadota bacterium]
MADLNEIYNTRIIELAADIPRTDRLTSPDATATAHSKLCGSTVTVDLVFDGDRVADYGQTVKACLLGQSSASVVGREIIGTTRDELRQVAERMRDMLKADGAGPEGRWADLRVLEPVKAYRARHASTLLVFDAVEKAFAERDAQVPAPNQTNHDQTSHPETSHAPAAAIAG